MPSCIVGCLLSLQKARSSRLKSRRRFSARSARSSRSTSIAAERAGPAGRHPEARRATRPSSGPQDIQRCEESAKSEERGQSLGPGPPRSGRRTRNSDPKETRPARIANDRSRRQRTFPMSECAQSSHSTEWTPFPQTHLHLYPRLSVRDEPTPPNLPKRITLRHP